jgi:hypothetical protein
MKKIPLTFRLKNLAGYCCNRLLFLLFAVMILYTISCKKDNDPEPVKEEILIGIYQDIMVDSAGESITASYNKSYSFSLDLNQNDTADLRFAVGMYGSPGMGANVQYTSSLSCLHPNIALYGEITQDTVFLHRHIRYESTGNGHYEVSEDYYDCRQFNQFYNVHSINDKFHPLRLMPNDTLSLSDNFVHENVSFIYTWSGWQSFFQSNDTTYISSSQYDYSCRALPYNTDIYLGFRLTDTKGRLGWIRFELGGGPRITLKEYAIQP